MQKLAGHLRSNRGSYAGMNASPSAHISMNGSGYNNPTHWRNKPNPVIGPSADLSLLGNSMAGGSIRMNDYSNMGRLSPADSRFRGF